LIKDASGLRDRLIVAGVGACFVLSGFAALLYQTAWMRQFSLVFGTSELAVAAVLSAYMGGLALGASLAARLVRRVVRPVLLYGLLEGGIALSALAVPSLLKLASNFYIGIFGGQPQPVDASGLGQSFFYLGMAFVVIAIPTTLMGATLPLLTKYVVRSSQQIGHRVGLLYAANTVGAIGGTVAAGFLLLPAVGLNGTVWCGVAVNLLVFLVAALIARNIARRDAENHHVAEVEAEVEAEAATPPQSSMEEGGGQRRRLWILPLILLSGVISFTYEVLWTRLLGHVLGGSITAFATMLAGFLGGIALGSAVAARFARNRTVAVRWFILVQAGIAVSSLLIYRLLPFLIPKSFGLHGNILLAMLVLLPATFFIGATYPLAVRVLALERADAASSSARVYSWNTVGAILGATAAAFFVIPALRYEGTVRLAVVANALLALAAAILIDRQPRLIRAAAAVFFLTTALFYWPAVPEAILRASPVYASPGGVLRHYEVGRSATVVVIEDNGFLNLRTNGLPEASTNLKGAPPVRNNSQMLATMPVLARPETNSMLIVGLGAGVALEGVPKSVKTVDVIELEPEVVKANLRFGDQRAINPLVDPRVKITINDARSALALTTKRYDAIVSQPSHPWTAGASHLYTREFMELAKDHLSPNGVYLQWMNSQFVDESLLRSLCATMLAVFPNVRIYQWEPQSLFFIGSAGPLEVEAGIARTGRPLGDDLLEYLQKGVGSVEDVTAALSMDQANVEAFARGGALITDNDNYMATMSARVMENKTALGRRQLAELLKTYDPLLQVGSEFRRHFLGTLNYPYISRQFEFIGLKQRAVDLSDSLLAAGDPQALVMIGLGQQRQGEREEATKNLLLALKADPDNQQARYALLEPWFGAILGHSQLPQEIAKELRALRGSGSDTLRGWLAASTGDMEALVKLDEPLASVLPTDLWYAMSVKLRAEWRIRVTTPEYQPRFANEATRLVDSAIAFFPDTEFLLLRIRSTQVAGDLTASVETARRLVYMLELELRNAEDGNLTLGSADLELKLRQVGQLGRLAESISADPRARETNLHSLEASIRQQAERLKALMSRPAKGAVAQ